MNDTPQIIRLEVSSQDVIRALEAEVGRLSGEVSYLESECAVWKPLADRLLSRAEAAEVEVIRWQQANREQFELLVKVEWERDRYKTMAEVMLYVSDYEVRKKILDGEFP